LSRPDTSNWQVSGQTINEYYFPLAKHIYPALKEEHIVDIVNYTCDDLIYLPVGHAKRMAAVLREQEREKHGLYFAGEYLAGTHTGAACASGRTIARTIHGACAVVREGWGFQPRPLATGRF